MKEELEDGKEVFAPSNKSKKRKRSGEQAGKQPKKSKFMSTDDDDDFIVEDGEEDERSNSGSDSEGDDSEDGSAEKPLTLEVIEEKRLALKETKKQARKERGDIDDKTKDLIEEMKALQRTWDEIDAAMRFECIEGRNSYSKGAIQRDFADGIKELDQETAQEEDEDNFNPDDEKRDYDEVARSLPVICCSSRAYQKMKGRMQRDNDVPGFRTVEETEIPQLQQHCKQLTEGVRASNCRRFLTDLSQVMGSLTLWASDDGTGLIITDAQRRKDTKFLKSRLATLDEGLDKIVQECLKEMMEALVENIFESFGEYSNEPSQISSSLVSLEIEIQTTLVSHIVKHCCLVFQF
jgi:hypothetical protein